MNVQLIQVFEIPIVDNMAICLFELYNIHIFTLKVDKYTFIGMTLLHINIIIVIYALGSNKVCMCGSLGTFGYKVC